MKKKIGAFGAGQFSLGTLVGGRPGTTIFQNPVGEGGGLGGVAYKDRARPPPLGPHLLNVLESRVVTVALWCCWTALASAHEWPGRSEGPRVGIIRKIHFFS